MTNFTPIKAKKRKFPLEKVVEKQYKAGVRKLGCKSYKFASENQRGVFDQVTLMQSEVLFVEVKAQKGVPSHKQIEFANECEIRGVMWCFIYGITGKDELLYDMENNVPLANSYNQPKWRSGSKADLEVKQLIANEVRSYQA